MSQFMVKKLNKTQIIIFISIIIFIILLIFGIVFCINKFNKNNIKDKSVVYLADFKQYDSFAHLRKCPRYYPYGKTIEALEIVYDILHKR